MVGLYLIVVSKRAEMGADRSGAGMWATGNAAGELPFSVETPSVIIDWQVGFSLRLSKDHGCTRSTS